VDSDRFGPIDFDQFHLDELPSLLQSRERVFSDADAEVVRPLAFQLGDGRAYTYRPTGHTFSVEQGADQAHTVVELPYDEWCAFAWELRSSFSMFYADQLSIAKGSFGQLVRWEPPLRVAFAGQVIYDIDCPPPILDGDGAPLDLSRRFHLDDDDAGIADFLARAGFVHLGNVLDDGEIDELRSVVDVAVAAARPDDRRSWWTTVDGRDICSRINYLNEHSEQVASLGSDPRFARIAAFAGPDLHDAYDRLDGNGVVIKVPGAADGLVDLPFHRDCGMGGHPVKCPMINVGIQLDAASAATGQLHMIPGSHQGTSRLPNPRELGGLPVTPLVTEPGDVTVHFGHTLHAAPPPTDRSAEGRRALYLTFVPPLTFEMVGPGEGYNDVLFTRNEGHVKHVDQLR
jgi:hypothetical protein